MFFLVAKRTTVFVKSIKLDADATSYNVRGLSSSTNYSLELTGTITSHFTFIKN